MGLAWLSFLKKASQYHLCVVFRLINAPGMHILGRRKCQEKWRAHLYRRAERTSQLIKGGRQSESRKSQEMLCRRHCVPQVFAEFREATHISQRDNLNSYTYLERDGGKAGMPLPLRVSTLWCVHSPLQRTVWERDQDVGLIDSQDHSPSDWD
jgi:hypothetical protein